MDTNNWRPPLGGEPATDAGDWRSQWQADSRQIIVNQIMDTLKRHLPFSGREGLLKKIAVRIEEKTYTAATSQLDYVDKISLKRLAMENKFMNTICNSLPNNSGGNSNRPPDPGSFDMQGQAPNQGQSLSMPMPANQSQTRQQLLSQNIQNNIPPAGVKNSAGLSSALPPASGLRQTPIPIKPGNIQHVQNHMQQQQQQQQQENLLQPSQLQSSQQSVMRPPAVQSSLSSLQQNQQSAIQHSSQSMLHQHPQSVLRQQQQPQQSSVVHQQQTPIPQQPLLPPQQQQQQQQQPQLMVQQPNSTNLPQNSNSIAQTGHTNGADWQEDVYQKIKVMKEMYYPELSEMYQKIAGKLHQHDSLPQQPKSDQLEKLKMFKAMLEFLMTILQLPKSNISPGVKEKLSAYEKQIVNFINTNRPRKPVPSLQPGQLPPPHSSPQVDQRLLVPKAGTLLQNASSPFVMPSLSTPVAPLPMPGDSEKPFSLSNAGNVGHQPTAGVGAQVQSLAIVTPGISSSPLLAEFTCPDGTHCNALSTISGKSSVTEQPLEHLIKAVKSVSKKALSASVSDIDSIVCMIDRIAGSAPGNGSRAAVGEDLVAMTKCRLLARNYITHDGTTNGTRKMRRYTSAMPLNVVSSGGSMNDSFKQLTGSETSDLESTATSRIKRPRIEANLALMEEIREINRRLIDTVVDISDEDVDPSAAAAERGEGIIVKCSFDAVALSPNLKSQYASAQMSPIQPLRLLVPTNYPNCSPILLDKFPVEVSMEYEDHSVKAKSRFSIFLQSISQPMSLGEIARTWDISARAVISEHAQRSGGGSFSSKYGSWENCLIAA